MMMKIVKMAIGFCVLIGIGHVYGITLKTLEEKKEPQIYSYIALKVPDTTGKMIFVKQVPESECETWRKDYFEASISGCKQCKVLKNSCTASVPDEYVRAMKKQTISQPYVYKPYKYPEISLLKGVPYASFAEFCQIEKKQFSKAECIN